MEGKRKFIYFIFAFSALVILTVLKFLNGDHFIRGLIWVGIVFCGANMGEHFAKVLGKK